MLRAAPASLLDWLSLRPGRRPSLENCFMAPARIGSPCPHEHCHLMRDCLRKWQQCHQLMPGAAESQRTILSMFLCTACSLLFIVSFRIQASKPYSTVEVTVELKRRSRSCKGYCLLVSSCLCLWTQRQAALMRLSDSTSRKSFCAPSAQLPLQHSGSQRRLDCASCGSALFVR